MEKLQNLPGAHTQTSGYSEVTETKEFWDSAEERADMPKEKLSPAWKAKAKARAAAAGRKYPNMVDNIWAARNEETAIETKPKLKNKTVKREIYKIQTKSMDPMTESSHGKKFLLSKIKNMVKK